MAGLVESVGSSFTQYGRLEMRLRRKEALRLKPYKDTTGHVTIGWGHNLEEGINEDIADRLLEWDIARHWHDVEKQIPVFGLLDPVRQNVLVEMCFNMGIEKLLGFRKTIQLLEAERWIGAAERIRISKYARQVGARAQELALMIETGHYL